MGVIYMKVNIKKSILVLFLALTFILPFIDNRVFAATDMGKWVKKCEMPTKRTFTASVVLGNLIYTIGGDGLSSVETYDPSTNTWARKSDMPIKIGRHSAVVLNEKIYIIGGYTGSEFLSSLYEYDPVSDIWTKKADMPALTIYHSAVALDGKIYVMGGTYTSPNGTTNGNSSKLQVYDPVSNTWSPKANMPEPRIASSAVALDGKIYIIGGSGGSQKDYSLLIYDQASNTWTKKTDALYNKEWLSSTVLDGKIYAMGGAGQNMLFVYDPLTDTWDNKGEMLDSFTNASAVTLNNKIYTMGGSSLYSVYEYSPNSSDDSIAESLTLNKTTTTLPVGQSETLIATILPDNITNKTLQWMSSDQSIVTVDSTGKITALKPGLAIITCRTTDGSNLTATCEVNATIVVQPIGGRAILEITLKNGNVKEYDLSMTEVNSFISWFEAKSMGSGSASFAIIKNTNIKPFKSRKEYIIFDNISSLEVKEYDE